MGIAILFRKDGNVSPFKSMLKRLIELPQGEHLLLCSGCIQEPPYSYSVTQDTGLLQAISKGCKGSVVIVSDRYASGRWKPAYSCFVTQMLDHAEVNGLSVIERRTKAKAKWHAKVAMKISGEMDRLTSLRDAGPIAGIIGSSNLTRPACQAPATYPFNHECDVFLWNDEESTVKTHLVEGAREVEEQMPGNLIVAAVDYLGLQSQLSEQEHLERLLERIWETTEETT